MNTEIELKYRLDESTAQTLLNQQQLGETAIGDFAAKEVIDVYFDTPDHRLTHAGYALRFRRQGDKAALQLKSLTPASGAWHKRRELHIPTMQPTQPEHWPDTPEADFLRKLLGDHPLQPLFTIHQTRHEAPLLDGSGQPFALLSLDDVQWVAGDQEARAWELEVELLPDKDEAALKSLQRTLAALPGLYPQSESKYERGLKMLSQK